MTPEPTSTGKNLVKKLAEVMKEVGRIPKNGRNDFHGYDFVKEADLVERMSGLLADRNIFVSSSTKAIEVIEHTKMVKQQAIMVKTAVLRVEYTFHDGDSGEKLTVESVGEIDQDGGKGLYKAMTGAEKYALMKNFLIATGDDPEQDGGQKKQARAGETLHVVVHPKPTAKPEQAPKQPASATPQQIGYIEKLAKEKGLYDPKNLFAPFGLQGQPSKAEATKIIDQLKAIKVGPQKAPARAA